MVSSALPARFSIVLPVKPPARGKSRLVGLPEEGRRRLAAAFALDTAAACLAAELVGGVLAVTDDASFSRQLVELGCAAIPDGASGDLNATLVQAAHEAARRWPDLTPAALCGDLPALRPADLDAALAAVPTGRAAYVGDATGLGTTLYTAPIDGFAPRFGVASRAQHDGSGAVALAGDLRSLRHDVDELADLRLAVGIGLGPRTAAAAAELLGW